VFPKIVLIIEAIQSSDIGLEEHSSFISRTCPIRISARTLTPWLVFLSLSSKCLR
jgi:hypothetical protein